MSPFDQYRLLSSPQLGRKPSLMRVTCFHSPIVPAHISGGWTEECRITAEVWRSAASERVGSPSATVEMTSGPVHSRESFPLERSTLETPAWPSMFSVKRILLGDSQYSHDGDAAIPGVTLRAFSPVAETVKMSPPIDPSSLISPPMNAMVLPSGDQRGTAICNEGLYTGLSSAFCAFRV